MPPVADRLYGQALDLVDPTDGPRRARLLLGRARAEAALRRLDHAQEMIEEACVIAEQHGDDATVAKARLALGEVQQKAGALDEAEATLGESIERFDALGDRAGMAEALRQRGMTELFRGANNAAEASISEARKLFEELNDRRGRAWALQNLAWISYVEGRADEAEGRLSGSAELFRELGDGGGLAWANGLMGFVRYHQGRYDEADALASEVLADAGERGDKWGQGMMFMLSAAVRLWSGHAESAIDAADESLAMFRSIGDRWGESQGAGMLGRALVMSGRVEDGLQVLHHGIEQFRSTDGFDEQTVILGSMLLLTALQIGDVQRAQEVMAALPAGRDPGLGSVEIAVGRALAEVQSGDAERGLALIEAVVRGDGAQSGFAHSAWALALAAAGRGAEVPEVLEQLDGLPATTYLDRVVARVAGELVLAAAGDESSVDAFTDVVATIDETEDRCAQAVVRLAEALALDSLGLPTADWALEEAERRLDELEITASGWRTAFGLVLAADKAPTGA
jgi:tetratricopeptide (TPR) repeat protein